MRWQDKGSFLLALAGALVLTGVGVVGGMVRDRAAAPAAGAAERTACVPFVTASPAPSSLCTPAPTPAVVRGYSPDSAVWWEALDTYAVHEGVDLAMPLGAAVTAAADGTVVRTGEDSALGYLVEIRHGDGSCTVYADLMGTNMVRVGDTVRKGDVIGSVGNSSRLEAGEESHLHFEVREGGKSRDPFLKMGE